MPFDYIYLLIQFKTGRLMGKIYSNMHSDPLLYYMSFLALCTHFKLMHCLCTFFEFQKVMHNKLTENIFRLREKLIILDFS